MTMKVLQTKRQIADARQELIDRHISCVDTSIMGKAKGLVKRTGLAQPLLIGDIVKSWDVLSTIEFLEQHVDKDSPILDMGCYASEVLVALHKAGFRNLAGIDLNPRLRDMPHGGSIRYETGDFMKTPFSDESITAVTTISVIEHGFNSSRLLGELKRILAPSGFFIASFDYWPEKIDTMGERFFDMDWLIFSQEEVQRFIEDANDHGLFSVGEMQFAGREKAIRHGGYDYTFGWLALQKRP
jgi:SAM-dependent methyltransferase